MSGRVRRVGWGGHVGMGGGLGLGVERFGVCGGMPIRSVCADAFVAAWVLALHGLLLLVLSSKYSSIPILNSYRMFCLLPNPSSSS